MFPQPQSRRQYLQFGLVVLCLACLVPTRLFLKSKKWRPLWTNKSKSGTRSSFLNNTAECRFFPEALFQFTNALHEKPELWALQPWTLRHSSSKRYPTWYFPGMSSPLLQAAFGGRRTVLVGDSTLFNMMRWMSTLMLNMTVGEQDQLGHLSLYQGNYHVNPEGLDQVGWDDATPPVLTLKDGTHIEWKGHRGDPGEAACQFEAIWTQLRQLRPHILIVNFGLHWLHLMGGARDVPLCSVKAWLQYEQWLEEVVRVAQESGVQLLLFKTTNSICMDHYWGEYSDAARLYERQDAYILSKCKREIQRLLEHHRHGDIELSEDDMARYCAKGVLDEYGSKDLNHRLMVWVEAQQKQQKHGLTIDIFNDHDVQSCAYSEPNDGRHYHPLNLMRIRLLANMIQCLYPKEG